LLEAGSAYTGFLLNYELCLRNKQFADCPPVEILSDKIYTTSRTYMYEASLCGLRRTLAQEANWSRRATEVGVLDAADREACPV